MGVVSGLSLVRSVHGLAYVFDSENHDGFDLSGVIYIGTSIAGAIALPFVCVLWRTSSLEPHGCAVWIAGMCATIAAFGLMPCLSPALW